MHKTKDIIVIGGGWAGLSSAVRLKQQGWAVQLYESSRQLGGRARCSQYKNFTLDNGQHILLGSCIEVFSLFKLLNINEQQYLQRQTLNLDLLYANKNIDRRGAKNLPQGLHIQPYNIRAPLHLLMGFLTAQGFSFKEKFFLIKFFVLLKLNHYQLKKDQNLLNILQKNHQSTVLIQKLWEPLCLSIMNTPIQTASAQIFFNVLRLSFDGKKEHSDLVLFSTPLCKSLAQHASQYLQSSPQPHQQLHLNSKITAIEVKNNTIIGVRAKHQFIPCSRLILATAPHASLKLLTPLSQCQKLVKTLKKIDYQAIYTVYLYYQEKFKLEQDMTGILNAYSQWVFDKSFTQQHGLLAIIISGPGKHQQISKDELVIEVNKELQALFSLPELDWGIVVVENKATINCTVENNQHRPSNSSPIKGLYLAGDYTDTGYPSTLEGAVKSGRKAAELVINN
ncbi:MAG: hydroxysqualene dehydroxylase HpnE [Pseudomonadota bacterium]